jgi:exosortase D (VPLPA-CTERM-specific)
MAVQFSELEPADGVLACRYPVWTIGALAVLAALCYLAFRQAIDFMVGQWAMPEFSDGYLIPFIAAFLIWQRRAVLERMPFDGSWIGLLVVLCGVGLDIGGRLAALYPVQHIALLTVICGLTLALVGRRAFLVLAAPLAVLVFMIPLPQMIVNPMSSQLQLLSSSIGVWLMRRLGVIVFLQGNVIDLGSYQLQVAQACSGLRYLLPLMTLGFLLSCFYRGTLWKKVVLFLSSIPITVLTNSARIAAIGVMVDRWGIGLAQGLVHAVQGWMMFMLSVAVMIGEVMALSGIGRDRRPWRESFNFSADHWRANFPARVPRRAVRALSGPLVASGVALALFSAAASAMPSAAIRVPQRQTFASFPIEIGQWIGRRQSMDPVYLDTLKLSDYLLADYAAPHRPPVNLYIAWYDQQSTGDATHSPRACLPGGGWRIDSLTQVPIAGVRIGSRPLRVNRALIEYGGEQQLVYYWFEQRGRLITNEYLVKWYLLVDSVLRHRTDGALVRLVVPIVAGTPVSAADRELREFAAAIAPQLPAYIPG